MHRSSQVPSQQRPMTMNPVSLNRGASGNAMAPSGAAAAASPGFGFMARPSTGAGSGGALGSGAQGQTSTGNAGATGSAGISSASGPFNRAFPFGASSMPPHLAAFSGAQQTGNGAASGAGNAAAGAGASQGGAGSLSMNDFPTLGGSFNNHSAGAGTLSYANSTSGNRADAFSTEDFPSLSDGFANGTGMGSNAAGSNLSATAIQEQASAAATLQHQRLAREQNHSQTLSAARGGFGEPERNYATKVGMQQPPGMPSAGQTWFNNTYASTTPAPPGGGAPLVLNGTATAGGAAGPGSLLGRQGTAPDVFDANGRPRLAPGSTNASQSHQQTPAKTPAQQVLTSPADRFGLLGLVSIIKMQDPDLSMLTMGSDLQTLGLSLDGQESLASTFVTPWSDNASAAAMAVEPEFHLPSCYNAHAPPPPHTKIASFSDETLFFLFYSAPRDVLQELAAQELYNRNWRFYRGGLNLWLTKEENVQPTHKDLRAEKGVYVFWDPASWSKVSREFVLAYDALEERSMGMSQAAILAANAAAAQHPSQQQQQQQPQAQQQGTNASQSEQGQQQQSTPAQQHQGAPERT